MAQFIERPDEEELASQEEATQEPEEVTPEPQPEDDLPEKYRNKDIRDIVRMHQEAEKLLGRQSSEVGELRKVVEGLVEAQSNNSAPQQAEEELDFFVEPEKAVSKAIENHPEIQAARQMSEHMKKQAVLSELKAKHPDYLEILKDTGFNDWVEASRVRTRLLIEADKNYDFDAADELLSSWKERKGIVAQAAQTEEKERKRQLKAASTGTAKGSGEAPSKKLYRREDIRKLMIEDPDRYLSLADEITLAYAENRVR
jgi:hypothetical protein